MHHNHLIVLAWWQVFLIVQHPLMRAKLLSMPSCHGVRSIPLPFESTLVE
jgi:hypothetical protein